MNSPSKPDLSLALEKSVAFSIGGAALDEALTAQEGPDYFAQAPLPYRASALEPVISREDLKERCEQHRKCIRALNRAAAEAKLARGTSIESLFAHAGELPKSLRQAAAAHWNISFFWAELTDQKENQEMPHDLLKAIEGTWRSFDEFKRAFVEAASEGADDDWLWLVRAADGSLKLTRTTMYENPLMRRDESEPLGRPLLCCPLWGKKSHRVDFAKRFFALANWQGLSKIFENATIKTPPTIAAIVH